MVSRGRWRELMMLAAVIVVALPATAWAQDPEVVAAQLDDAGVAVAEDADANVDAIADVAADLAADGGTFGFVVLGAPPASGTVEFADAVLDAWGAPATVVVLTDEDIFAVSEVYDERALDAALDAAFDDFDTSPTSGFATFGRRLIGQPAGTTDTPSRMGGGFPWGWAAVGVVAVGGILLALRGRHQAADRRQQALQAARAEIAEQVTAIGELVFDLEAQVSLAQDPAVEERYEEATATFRTVQELLPEAADHVALEELAARADRAHWQLEAVSAVLDGRPVPPEPTEQTPAACFFDPTHRVATEDATVKTPAGTAQVRVCTACADRLEAGQAPTPRQIDVGGHRVPSARAPRSHGGRGLEWLSGAAEVLIRGMSRGTTIDMGGPARPGRPRGVRVPPLRVPGRSGSASTTSRAGRSRSSRARAGRSRTSSGRGRAGRKR